MSQEIEHVPGSPGYVRGVDTDTVQQGSRPSAEPARTPSKAEQSSRLRSYFRD